MARCAYCKAETILYDHDVAICLECANEREVKRKPPNTYLQVRTTLLQDVLEATARANTARESFDAVMGNIPSGIPLPDGTQRIHNASRELSAAQKEMMKAHTRLNDYISRGVVPQD